MRILVTGAAGHLGTWVAREFADGHEVVPVTRETLDLRDDRAVASRVAADSPEVIINCAAYNDVDGAEDQPETALDVNALAVRTLALAATRHGALLVHYSSDFVFDGCASRPYVEEDEPAPQGIYASSKLLGDWFAMEAPRHYVLRVESLFGSSRGAGRRHRSSVDTIAEALRAGGEARVFTDRTVSPSYVRDVAWATRQIVERAPAAGLYHCVNSGYCTWYELGLALQRHAPGGRAVPVAVADVPLRVRRPKFAALSNAKLARAGIVMPAWREALERYVFDWGRQAQ